MFRLRLVSNILLFVLEFDSFCKDHANGEIFAMRNTAQGGDNPIRTNGFINESIVFIVLG
jgi:hypothetical protein